MTKLNKNTKKAKQLIDNYERATNNGELYQVYNNYSCYKERAINYCKTLQKTNNGKNGKITSFNSQIFTYAFVSENDNKTTLYYITPNNEYIIEL